jgi:hypothetical protein
LAQGAQHLEYDVVGVGEQDTEPPPAQWAAAETLPFVATDVVDASGHAVFSQSRIVTHQGVRVGVLVLTGHVSHDGWHVLPAAEALRAGLQQVRSQSNRVVLLTHVPLASLPADLLRQVDVRFVVHGDGRIDAEKVSVPSGGRYVAVVRIQGGAHTSTVAASPVDPATNLDPALVSITSRAIQESNRLAATATQPALAAPSGYMGDQACTRCHEDQARQWSTTAHAHAFATLVKAQRDHFPECMQCHVTGVQVHATAIPAPGFAYLPNVQCEACHGPGQKHCQAPTEIHLRKTPSVTTCLACHDPSIDQGRFDFHTYWPKIRH